MIYLTAIGYTLGGSSTAHIYKKHTEQHNRQKQYTEQHSSLIRKSAGLCPVFARYTLAFALQLRKKHGKPSVRVVGECQSAHENRIYRTEHT